MYDHSNIFAKILRRELPAEIIFENNDLLAFKDKFPQAKTHILLIPKKSFVSFEDFIDNSTIEEVGAFFKIANTLATEELKLTDFKILSNIGKLAGQEIPHFHLHILGYK